jgi:short-subunit dehydrogenase
VTQIRDSRILVTGASRGIGRAAAVELARRGARLALAARTRDSLEELAEELRGGGTEVHVIPTDVAEEAQVRAMVKAANDGLGGIDVLINNAGLGLTGPVKDVEPDDLRYVFEVNVVAPHIATTAVLPQMLRRRSGHIVNVGSVASHIAAPGLGGYSATKFALKALTDALRAEVKNKGVKVSLICPGPIKTEFIEAVRGKAKGHIPTNQIGAPVEDAARTIAGAIQHNRAEVFVPAYYQALVGANSLAPQFMRMFGADTMRVSTRIAERFL